MISFSEKDLDALALVAPAVANNNVAVVENIVAQARVERSKHMHDMIDAGIAKLKTRIQKYRAANRAMAQLNSMSTRELADLGVTRCGIAFAVQGEKAAHVSFANKLKTAVLGFVEKYENWRLQRASYAELVAMDTRELSDIGITKGDLYNVLNERGALANDNLTAANSNQDKKLAK
ncbi:DUF1127 domain-containing protein [Sneathiella limimaris]|uniref:DUF1127 domain-containing protein n=1 Tax=Sneathiella limimaris TaxID=1964213 RepID=UPI0019D282F8|nr:DUF1127 domain-containing protein [Sneathiella limimaris]